MEQYRTLNNNNLMPKVKDRLNSSVRLGANLIEFGIIGYMFVLLFNGVLMHYGLSIKVLETIRPILPEFFLVLSILGMILRKELLISKDILLLLGIIVIVFIASLSCFTLERFLVEIRDIFVPFLFLGILSGNSINNKTFCSFKKATYILFAIYIISSTILGQIQYSLGYKYTSEYFLGYVTWGDEGQVRLTSGVFGFRALGTTGDPSTFGFYSLFAILFFLFRNKRVKLIDWALSLVGIYSIFLSGNKTALIVVALALIYSMLSLFIKSKKVKRAVIYGLIILFILYFVYLLFASEDNWTLSFMERLSLWKELLGWENLSNLFLPHSIFLYSNKGGSGITSFFDNTYLYLLFSVGIIGGVVIARVLYVRIKATYKDQLMRWLSIMFVLSAISTNLFVGRNIVGFYMIFLGIFYSFNKHQLRSK